MSTRRVTLTRPVTRPTGQPRTTGAPTPLFRGGGGSPGAGQGLQQKKEAAANLALGLTEAERRELASVLLAAHPMDSKPGTQSSELAAWTAGIQTALEAAIGNVPLSGSGQVPLGKLLGASGTWAHIAAFTNRSGLDQLTKPEQWSCVQVVAGLLVEHAQSVARRSGAPLTTKLVVNCLAQLYSVFDRAFPGYLNNPLATRLLWRAILSNHQRNR